MRNDLRLDQGKLDGARRVLGARTETEAVEQALDLVAFRQEVIKGVRRMAGSRRLGEILGEGEAG